MSTTPVSLLERLKSAQPDAEDWHRLHEIYLPVVSRWLARVPDLLDSDVPDLAQEVLVVLFKEIPEFQRQRVGSFRKFLKLTVLNRLRAHWKDRRRRPAALGGDATVAFLAELEDPNSGLSHEWDREHNEVVFQRLLATARRDFDPRTWDAFQKFAVENLPAKRVAAELQMTENAVLLAKSRILKRLRTEAAGLID